MRLVALSSVTWLAIAACVAAQQPPSRPQPGSTAGVIEVWLECVECRDGELQAVVKLGASRRLALGRRCSLDPAPAKLQSYEKYLRKMYSDMKAYEKTHPKNVVPFTEDEFVKRDMAKLTNLYRVRAATALGEIGGPDAATALDQALKLPLDPYVAMKVKQARSKIKCSGGPPLSALQFLQVSARLCGPLG